MTSEPSLPGVRQILFIQGVNHLLPSRTNLLGYLIFSIHQAGQGLVQGGAGPRGFNKSSF